MSDNTEDRPDAHAEAPAPDAETQLDATSEDDSDPQSATLASTELAVPASPDIEQPPSGTAAASRTERVVSVAVIVLASVLVGLPALLVLFTFLHRVPYLGMSSFVVPPRIMWFVTLPLVGGAVGLYRWYRRRDRFSLALLVVAVLATSGAVVIAGRMVAAVEDAGADINLLRTFGFGAADAATPDVEVVYTSYAGEDLLLSIYEPSEATADSLAPVLVYIHGGGWIKGSRRNRSVDMRWFADHGWLTVSVGYTLSSDDRHLWDVTHGQIGCALAWVVENVREYGGDSNRLSMTGDSAGGNLVINTAYMANEGTLRSSCGGPTPTVGAVSTIYPAVDPADFHDNSDAVLGGLARDMTSSYTGGSPEEVPDRYASIASATYISSSAPPTLMIVGEADHLVPPGGAYRFADQARDAGIEVDLVRVPYADHVFDTRGAGGIGEQAFRQLTERWLRQHGQAP